MLRPSIFDDLYEIGDPVANRPFRASVSCGIADAVAFSRAEASPANAVKAVHLPNETITVQIIAEGR